MNRDRLQFVEDNIVAASDSKLNVELEKYLPGLLDLSSQSEIRNKIISILSHVMQRIKSHKTVLPIRSLIYLVNADKDPFVVNFALTFVDIGIKNQPLDTHNECVRALLASISQFPLYSNASNGLCAYIIPLINGFDASIMTIEFEVAMKIVSEYVLDICLIRPIPQNLKAEYQNKYKISNIGICKGSIGYVCPGTNVQRMDRIVGRKFDYVTDDTVIDWKQRILASYKSLDDTTPSLLNIIDKSYAVICLLVLSYDGNDSISTIAKEKLQHLTNQMRIIPHKEVKSGDYHVLTPLVETLITEYILNSPINARTCMKSIVLMELCRWLSREFIACNLHYLDVVRMFPIVTAMLMHVQPKDGVETLQFITDMPLTSSQWNLSDKLLEKYLHLTSSSNDSHANENINYYNVIQVEKEHSLDVALITSITVNCTKLFNCACNALSHLHLGAYWSNDPINKECRKSIYHVIEQCCSIVKILHVDVINHSDCNCSYSIKQLLPVLFSCIDVETDNVLVACLFQSLNALRLLYSVTRLPSLDVCAESSGDSTHFIRDLIHTHRVSALPKKRLVVYQWCKTLYDSNNSVEEDFPSIHVTTLETMVMLMGKSINVGILCVMLNCVYYR